MSIAQFTAPADWFTRFQPVPVTENVMAGWPYESEAWNSLWPVVAAKSAQGFDWRATIYRIGEIDPNRLQELIHNRVPIPFLDRCAPAIALVWSAFLVDSEPFGVVIERRRSGFNWYTLEGWSLIHFTPRWRGLAPLFVKLWLIAAVGMGLAARLLWSLRRLWYARGACQSCGHSRDGLPPGAVCPECGTPFDAALASRSVWRRPLRWPGGAR